MSTPLVSYSIRFNSGMFLLSGIASFIQIAVFSCVGAKGLSLFLALFASLTFYSIVKCTVLFLVSTDITFLTGMVNPSQAWMACLYQFGTAFGTSTNMLLCFICFNVWVLLQLQNSSYLENMFSIHLVYIAISFLAAMVDVTIYFAYNQVQNTVPYYASIFSIFFIVIVGGLSAMGIIVRLALNRLECVKVLKRSSTTMSLLYRMLFGLIVLVIIGAITISFVLQPVQASTMYDSVTDSFTDSIIGIAVSVVFGSSQECLQIWRSSI